MIKIVLLLFLCLFWGCLHNSSPTTREYIVIITKNNQITLDSIVVNVTTKGYHETYRFIAEQLKYRTLSDSMDILEVSIPIPYRKNDEMIVSFIGYTYAIPVLFSENAFLQNTDDFKMNRTVTVDTVYKMLLIDLADRKATGQFDQEGDFEGYLIHLTQTSDEHVAQLADLILREYANVDTLALISELENEVDTTVLIAEPGNEIDIDSLISSSRQTPFDSLFLALPTVSSSVFTPDIGDSQELFSSSIGHTFSSSSEAPSSVNGLSSSQIGFSSCYVQELDNTEPEFGIELFPNIVTIKDTIRAWVTVENKKLEELIWEVHYPGDIPTVIPVLLDTSGSIPQLVFIAPDYAMDAHFTVRVTDGSGNTASDIFPLAVYQDLPIIEFSNNRTCDWGDTVLIKPMVTDEQGTIESYQWKLTQNNAYEIDSSHGGSSILYFCESRVADTIFLTVTDDDGQSVTDSTIMQRSNTLAGLVDTTLYFFREIAPDSIFHQFPRVDSEGDSIWYTGFTNYGLGDVIVTSTGEMSFRNDVSPLDMDSMTVYVDVSDGELNQTFKVVIALHNNGIFIDSRDGQEYGMVVIGSQMWMSENLNYSGDDGMGTRTFDVGLCHGNDYYPPDRSDSENCDSDGRLYRWSEVMGLPARVDTVYLDQDFSDHQGICPMSWHVADSTEWQTLLDYVESEHVGKLSSELLRSISGWKPECPGENSNGIDAFDFNAVPAGGYFFTHYISGIPSDSEMGYGPSTGADTNWWISNERHVKNSYYATFWYTPFACRGMGETSVNIFSDGFEKKSAFSLRCIHD